MWIPVYLIVSGGLKIVSQFLEDKSLHCTMTYSFRLTWGILYAASLRRILCWNPSSESKQWPSESVSDEIVSPIHSSRRQHQQREPRSEYWLSESDWLHSPSLYFTIPIQTNIPSQIKKNWNSTLFQFRLKVFSLFFRIFPDKRCQLYLFLSAGTHTHSAISDRTVFVQQCNICFILFNWVWGSTSVLSRNKKRNHFKNSQNLFEFRVCVLYNLVFIFYFEWNPSWNDETKGNGI